jgi:hypothetical protein
MLIQISITTDRDTFNPLLEPEVKGSVSVWAHYDDQPSQVIPFEKVVLGVKTKLSSGDAEVIRLQGDQIIPIEGGLVTLEAIVIENDQTFQAEVDVVVRPFFYDYHQTLMLKIFSIHPRDHEGTATCSFKETLEVIRKTDNLSRGIPKILYLEGYQEGGFDQLFPAWLPVDPRLKREEDETALESLRWLMREAKKYNTIVSLHIDMVQAYTNSPLWDEYKEKDVLSRDENGEVILLTQNNNRTAKMNLTSYTREWKEGLAQRRIDQLIEAVPEILDAKTIHLDNLVTYYGPENRPLSPWHAKPENGGIDMYKEVETIRKIFRYFRDRGIDVTGEGILWAHPPKEGFYGIQGYSWWGRGSIHSMEVPERLSARGAQSRSEKDWDVLPGDFRFASNIHGELVWLRNKEEMPELLHRFCTMALPYYFLSQFDRLTMIDDNLHYSGGVVAGESGGHKIIRQSDFVLVDDGDVFVPAIWKPKEIIAYSTEGYSSRSWLLPQDWAYIKKVDLYSITLEGSSPIEKGISTENSKLVISLEPGEAIAIVPAS